MIRHLVKNGNSKALTLDKTMRDHLGLTSDEVEVTLQNGKIILEAPKFDMDLPRRRETFEEAFQSTLDQFDEALRNLAK